MSIAYLNHGQDFTLNNLRYQIDRYIGNQIQIIESQTYRVTQISINDFLRQIANGEIKFPSANRTYIADHIKTKNGERIIAFLQNYPENIVNQTKNRRHFLETYIKEYGDIRSQEKIGKALQTLWKQAWGKQPNPATVARWLKRYIEANCDIRSLCPANFLKGNRVKRYDSEVTQFCQQAIKKIYLKEERGSIQSTLDEAKILINHENKLRPLEIQLPLPTKSFISSLIHELDKRDVYAARFGKSASEHKYRNAVNSVITSRPLERVEIDHTKLDIILVDAKTGIVFGRPWLTLVIDHYSKSILGFSLSFDPPSQMTVARALKMALQPKVNINKRWSSIKGEWPMFGLMQNLVVDNGLEFHGESFQEACLMIGINISYCPRKKGWWKATVERALGTLNRNITDGLPGRTFSNPKERANYKSEKNAILPIEALEEMIAKWIVDIYHHTTHDTLGKSPISVWNEEIRLNDIPIIDNINELDAVWGILEKRKLSHKGIEINSLFYNSDELRHVLSKFESNLDIKIKWFPEDVGYIYVLPPDGSFLKVPVIEKLANYANGLSKYQHDLIIAHKKENLDESNDEDHLLRSKAELNELTNNSIQTTKKNKRLFNRNLQKHGFKKLEVLAPEKTQTKVNIRKSESFKNSSIPKFSVKESKRTEGGSYHE